jgi:hypothetical protein
MSEQPCFHKAAYNKTGKVYTVPEYTHAFFANAEFLVNDCVIYLNLDNFSFKLCKSRGLKVFCKCRKSIRTRHTAFYLCGSILDSYARDLRIESW